jgi:hypothetical protein
MKIGHRTFDVASELPHPNAFHVPQVLIAEQIAKYATQVNLITN